jgi:2-iminobutanoate/2-iminopropanoate deaminase
MTTRLAISTPAAPAAIGPYSQAVRVGDLVFLCGQIPLDPQSGELVQGGVEAQTRRVMDNLGAVLEASGVAYEHIVKTTVYLTSLADFAAVNSVYATYFPTSPPARSLVQVAALPRGAVVEVDAIACATAVTNAVRRDA